MTTDIVAEIREAMRVAPEQGAQPHAIRLSPAAWDALMDARRAIPYWAPNPGGGEARFDDVPIAKNNKQVQAVLISWEVPLATGARVTADEVRRGPPPLTDAERAGIEADQRALVQPLIDKLSDLLPAGPELDRLVAEKVMGWHPPGTGRDDRPRWYQPDGGGIRRQMEHHEWDGSDAWEPSTNIAHAWEVVEKLRPWIKLDARGDGMGKWAVTVWNGKNDGNHAVADTAPLAIVRAALKACR